LDDGTVIGGPTSAVGKHAKKHARVILGDEKQGYVARKLGKILDADVNEIQRFLPAGQARVSTV
jgi:hypothetical protein